MGWPALVIEKLLSGLTGATSFPHYRIPNISSQTEKATRTFLLYKAGKIFHHLKFWLKTLIPTAKFCISNGNKHEALICLDFNNSSSEAPNG